MSEIRKRRHYINIGSFKLNRISLLNQSNLNNSFEKLNIPKSKIVINNATMPFNIFFNPVRNLGSNSKNRENYNKINPLTEKNKIIRKHNILQKIDFNINLIRNNNKKENKKNPINLNNNIHDKLSLHINKITTNFHNNYNKKTNNSKNANDFNCKKALNLNLPFLSHNKENMNKNNSKSNLYNNNNNINLHTYIDTSFLFNNLQNENIISQLHKNIKNLKKYSKIFTNDKIKKSYSQNPKKLKVNYTEHLMVKEFNNSILKEDNRKDKKIKNDNNTSLNNKNDEIKINDKSNINNDENEDNNNSSKDSNDDICDINEIEKIISKTSYNIYPHNINNKNSINNNNSNYLLNKSGNESQNKKHIFLNSLYRMQKINDNLFFEHNKTSFNNYMNMKNKSSNKSNKVSQGTNTENRMDCLTNDMTLNIFNQSYFGNDDNLSVNEKNKKDLMPYNFKKKIIKNNRTFNFHNSVNNSNSKKFKKIVY